MFDTNTTSDSDAGVSPVIGVILMVAITVILAAVIGTFVLDLAGNLNQSAQASVTFDEDTNNNNVVVQAVSIQSADFVEVRVGYDEDTSVEDGGATDTDYTLSGGNQASGSYSDLGGTNPSSGSTQRDIGSVGGSVTLDYDTDGDGADSGTLTAVGYLEGEGSVLQTYDFGG